eukprot:gene2967-3539_t
MPPKRRRRVGADCAPGAEVRGAPRRPSSSAATSGVEALQAPTGFSLSESLVSHGHVALAPNVWRPPVDPSADADGGVFERPFRVGEGAVRAKVTQRGRRVLIEWRDYVPGNDATAPVAPAAIGPEVRRQAARMLRLSADLGPFHAMHATAKERRWGRTYCGPCLWEDLIKCITNCNMQWYGTVEMNRKLCSAFSTPHGAFPTPRELALHEPEDLKQLCRLGYRASRVADIARRVADGFDLEGLQGGLAGPPGKARAQAEAALLSLPGVGQFVLRNVQQLCGRTDVLPFDTETHRLWVEKRGASADKACRAAVLRDAELHYRTHYPGHEWQAYWFDLWRNYEARRGLPAPRWPIPTARGGEAAFCGIGVIRPDHEGSTLSRKSPPPPPPPESASKTAGRRVCVRRQNKPRPCCKEHDKANSTTQARGQSAAVADLTLKQDRRQRKAVSSRSKKE